MIVSVPATLRAILIDTAPFAGAIMAAPAAVAVAQAAGVSDSGGVTFNASEIAIITALVGSVVAGLAFVFRLLLASKDATVASAQSQITSLTAQVQQQHREQIELLRETVSSSERTMGAVRDSLAQLAQQVRDQIELNTSEHMQMLAALQAMDRRRPARPAASRTVAALPGLPARQPQPRQPSSRSRSRTSVTITSTGAGDGDAGHRG